MHSEINLKDCISFNLDNLKNLSNNNKCIFRDHLVLSATKLNCKHKVYHFNAWWDHLLLNLSLLHNQAKWCMVVVFSNLSNSYFKCKPTNNSSSSRISCICHSLVISVTNNSSKLHQINSFLNSIQHLLIKWWTLLCMASSSSLCNSLHSNMTLILITRCLAIEI